MTSSSPLEFGRVVALASMLEKCPPVVVEGPCVTGTVSVSVSVNSSVAVSYTIVSSSSLGIDVVSVVNRVPLEIVLLLSGVFVTPVSGGLVASV